MSEIPSAGTEVLDERGKPGSDSQPPATRWPHLALSGSCPTASGVPAAVRRHVHRSGLESPCRARNPIWLLPYSPSLFPRKVAQRGENSRPLSPCGPGHRPAGGGKQKGFALGVEAGVVAVAVRGRVGQGQEGQGHGGLMHPGAVAGKKKSPAARWSRGPTDGRKEILTLNYKCAANPKEPFCTGDHMSDKPGQDTEKSKQAARPIFWFLGFAGIMIVGAIVYGVV